MLSENQPESVDRYLGVEVLSGNEAKRYLFAAARRIRIWLA